MLQLILIIIAICVATFGLVYLIDKVFPQKLRPVLIILFALLSIFLGYKIYKSVLGPIEFNAVKQERFAKVISSLKDIRDSQEAYKTVNGQFAKDFPTLINFVENGKYTITQQKDSSFMRYNKSYQIDMQVDTIIVDTLGFVQVKDSLFKTSTRFKTMMNIPGAQNDEKFEMKADFVDKSGYRASVFEAKAEKDILLYDQPQDLRDKENAEQSVEQVNGSSIKVGSLNDVSINGNWPPVYDRKEKS